MTAWETNASWLPAVACALAAAAAVLCWPKDVRVAPAEHATSRPRWSRHGISLLGSVLSGVGVALVVGGLVGAVLGVVSAVVARTLLTKVESPTARARRLRLAAEFPAAVGILGSCLRSGADLHTAVVLVGDAFGGPVGEQFAAISHQTQLGIAPATIWGELADDPLWSGLARAVLRSTESGASVADAVLRLAEDAAASRRSAGEVAARRVGVMAAAPLGLCFLPAFLLVGILPMVVGLFSTMSFWR